MNLNKLSKLCLLVFLLLLFSKCKQGGEKSIDVFLPDGKIKVTFMLTEGVPYYQVSRSGKEVIKSSKLGFTFKDVAPLNHNLTNVGSQKSSFDETWIQPWGEVEEIRNHYNELRIQLEETSDAPRKMNLIFRVYDYGLGFRYELPEQDHLNNFQIMDEETEFTLSGDYKAWWIPAYQRERYEYLYKKSLISSIPNDSVRAVHTPLDHRNQRWFVPEYPRG